MPPSNVSNNLNGLGELLGGFDGVVEGVEEQAYMGSVIRAAHKKTANIFDIAAAATGSTGRLSHMYEYGTPGITRGRPEHPDPTAPSARLYVHQIIGEGSTQEVGFDFRPAVTRNPEHTTASTGVASKYLRKLSKRKHVFWNRAMVMETGMEVSINAKNGRFLFVPFGSADPKNPKNKKNFVLWDTQRLGAIHATPGEATAGNFTAFWLSWWQGEGANIMGEEIVREVRNDVEEAILRTQKRAAAEGRKLTRAQAVNVRYAANRSAKLTERMFKEFTAENRRAGYGTR